MYIGTDDVSFMPSAYKYKCILASHTVEESAHIDFFMTTDSQKRDRKVFSFFFMLTWLVFHFFCYFDNLSMMQVSFCNCEIKVKSIFKYANRNL